MSKITFELHITSGNPLYFSFTDDLTVKECYEQILLHVDNCTIIHKETILDVFTEDKQTENILSLKSEDKISIGDFISQNKNYFPVISMSDNVYKVYVIDKMYFYNKNSKLNIPIYENVKKREIKTNHWSSFVENIKKNFVTIYI